jgi:hypothetical protein
MHLNISMTDGTILTTENDKFGQVWREVKARVDGGALIERLRLTGMGQRADIVTPSGAKGYFAMQKHLLAYPEGIQTGFIGVGFYDGNKVSVVWASLPDGESVQTEDRDVATAGFGLIQNA